MKTRWLLYLLFLSLFTSLWAQPIQPVPEVWGTDTWDGTQWQQLSRVTYSFDADCLAFEILSEFVDFDTGQLQNASLSTLTYDSNDLPTFVLTQIWDVDTQTFVDELRTTITNDGTNILQSTNERFDNGIWQNDSRITNIFNAGAVTEILEETWDIDNSVWVNETRTLITYNANGLLDIETSQNWDTMNSVWVNDIRVIFSYLSNPNDKQQTLKTESWEGGQWINSRLLTYTYDGNNFVVASKEDQWNLATMQYENSQQAFYTNNSEGFVTEVIRQSWFSVTSTWLNSSRESRSYPACASLATNSFEGKELLVYPNPADHTLYLHSADQAIDDVQLVDLSGREVYATTANMLDISIDVSAWAPGVYFLRWSDGVNRYSKKLIIAH